MRASRLLQTLLLLQNRGRMTCAALARELEVTRRTVLRDVDALTEAGLPIVVTRGNQGGIELGFNYRTRLTGLNVEEAEAVAVILAQPNAILDDLGMRQAGTRAMAKLVESFPDRVRETIEKAQQRFCFADSHPRLQDERVAPLAKAIKEKRVVTIASGLAKARVIHPVALVWEDAAWSVKDARKPDHPVPLDACGTINISARMFT